MTVQDAEPESAGEVVQITHWLSTHAPLRKRYVDGQYRSVGESSEYGRIDPASGGRFTALQRSEPHTYLKDYKVGPSYGATLFVAGTDGEDNTVSHDALEAALKEVGLWSDGFERVVIPKGMDYGEPTWYNGFKMAPPSRAPSRVGALASKVESAVGSGNTLTNGAGNHGVVEAWVDDPEAE